MTMWFAESLLCFSGLLFCFSLLGPLELLLDRYWYHLRGQKHFFPGHSLYTYKALRTESSSFGLFSSCLFLLRVFLQPLLVLPGKGRAIFCFLEKDQEMPFLGCLLLLGKGLGDVGLGSLLLQDG